MTSRNGISLGLALCFVFSLATKAVPFSEILQGDTELQLSKRADSYTVSATWDTCLTKRIRVTISSDNNVPISASIQFTIDGGNEKTLVITQAVAGGNSYSVSDNTIDHTISWEETYSSLKGTITVKKCSVVNKDPHMITFDGIKYEFQGPCTYVLTQDCTNIDKPSFQVTADFRGKYSVLKSKYLTRIDAVNIHINGTDVVRILKNNAILIHGERSVEKLSIIGDNEVTVETSDDGHPTVRLNKIGMLLEWMKESSEVDISFTDRKTHGHICGLLGNNNDNPEDDFMKPDRTIVTDVYEFGNSWVVPGSCP